jgi:hypothetical protein
MCFNRQEPASPARHASSRHATDTGGRAALPADPRLEVPATDRPARLGSLTGPSRTITVEPIEMPRREPASPPPDRPERPAERPPAPPRPTEEPVPAR